ncbi:hypothetical protein NBRC3293_2485 [Gluconobacter oxydans NBRC 3293]|uniref:Uncharacterized protein n=2 Tax=Gluconobacter oxydans TaxID=442 RepID=A0A829WME4_GLUOY|nr:hypothetical protein NBRC3293_2485 [Gluconobacter oxydans NBRC 3293]
MENENAELKRQIAEQSDAAQAALCRAMCEKDTVIQSWAQRYVALCSINAMLEQKNARLEGDTDYPHWSKI